MVRHLLATSKLGTSAGNPYGDAAVSRSVCVAEGRLQLQPTTFTANQMGEMFCQDVVFGRDRTTNCWVATASRGHIRQTKKRANLLRTAVCALDDGDRLLRRRKKNNVRVQFRSVFTVSSNIDSVATPPQLELVQHPPTIHTSAK